MQCNERLLIMQHTRQRQRGSVFLISLMLLIVVTLLTFTVSESVLLQEKMTGSSRDNELALQAAEYALMQGEAAVRGMDLNKFTYAFSLTGDLNANKGYYDGTACDGLVADCYMNKLRDVFAESTWVNAIDASSVSCGNGSTTCKLKGQYIIIKLGTITATGSGAAHLEAVTNQYQSQSEQVIGLSWKYKVMARGVGNNSQNTRVLISYFAQTEPTI